MRKVKPKAGDELRPEYKRSDFGPMIRGKYAARLPHDRLAGLMAELEQEKGPIDPQVLEEIRRAWPDG